MAEFGIASRLVAPKIDPLAIAGQAQAVQAGALNNRLLNQNVEQTMAQRRAAQASVNPDGTFDASKYVGQLGVEGASPEALAGAQQQKLAQIQEQIGKLGLSKADLELTGARWKKIGDVSKALLGAKGPDGQPVPLTREAVTQAMKNDLISSGMFHDKDSQAQVVSFVTSLPDDPAAIRQALAHVGMQSDMTSESIGMLLGAPRDTDTGSNIVTRQTSPLTGDTTTAAVIAKGRSPSEKAALVPTYDEKGQRTVLRTSGDLVGDAAPGTTRGPVAASGPALGEPEAAKASADQFTADVNDAGGFAQRIQGLNNAEKAIAKATTGKGGQTVQDWGALVNTLAPGLVSDEQRSKLKNFDEARKYLTDYANRRGAALGMGTDAGREMIHAANPSVDINKAAAQDIIKVIKGLERMQNAQVAAAKAAGIGPAQYSSWRADWNRSVDPAGFMADQIPAAARAKVIDKMSDAQVARYLKGVQAGIDAGYFTKEDLRKK